MRNGEKTKKGPARAQDAGSAERAVFVTDPEVGQELEEVSRLKSRRQRPAKMKIKSSATAKLPGGDVDAAVDMTGSLRTWTLWGT